MEPRARMGARAIDRVRENRVHPVARRLISGRHQIVDSAEIMAQKPRRHPGARADRPNIGSRQATFGKHRPDERSVGKEVVGTCSSRWPPKNTKKKEKKK